MYGFRFKSTDVSTVVLDIKIHRFTFEYVSCHPMFHLANKWTCVSFREGGSKGEISPSSLVTTLWRVHRCSGLMVDWFQPLDRDLHFFMLYRYRASANTVANKHVPDAKRV